MDAAPSVSGQVFVPSLILLSFGFCCFFSSLGVQVIHLRFNVSCIIQANIDHERVFFFTGEEEEGKEEREKNTGARLLFSWESIPGLSFPLDSSSGYGKILLLSRSQSFACTLVVNFRSFVYRAKWSSSIPPSTNSNRTWSVLTLNRDDEKVFFLLH